MGEHRGRSGVRGISKGPILVLVLVALIVGGLVGWRSLADRISDQGKQAAGTCVEGERTVDVTVDPSIAAQVDELGKRYTQTAPVVRDHCISISVHAQPSAAIATALGDAPTPWDDATLGPRPALWIATSSFELAPLVGKSVIDGDPRSLANSPIVLAVGPATAAELTTSNAGWASLPPQLTVALPAGSTQTVMATQAIAAGAGGAGAGPVTPEQAASSEVRSVLNTLALRFQTLPMPPATTADALAALSTGAPDSETAVPATEQSIAQSANAAITSFAPAGATPVADYPGVIVAGESIDETASRAAAQFVDFMRDPNQSSLFVGAGFRVDGQNPPDLGALTPVTVTTPLSAAGAETAAALNETVAHPVPVRSATIVVDSSTTMGTDDGGSTRLKNVAAALSARLEALPDATVVTVRRFGGGNADGEVVVPTGPLSEPQRRAEVSSALGELEPAGKDVKYPALAAAYTAAVAGFAPTHANSVVLITSSQVDESTMTKVELLKAMSATTDPTRPVRIDVLVVGPESDVTTLREITQQTGGTLVHVDSTTGPALPDAIAELMP
ncbi:hypothetical protein ABH922_002191 [Rhodococcus sp. 27YEA15]|uniref:hypothetical protein n=1 Tax=Rhodococcus sp. 27YEA15 TaxID=3156259 RepID=UPI003C7C3BD6